MLLTLSVSVRNPKYGCIIKYDIHIIYVYIVVQHNIDTFDIGPIGPGVQLAEGIHSI